MRTFHLSGHIGASVSALVDGQLSAAEEERAWAHIVGCPGCRRLVEREGWTKRRLSALSAVPAQAQAPQPPQRLLGSLYDIDAWADVDRIEHAGRRRRAAVAVVAVGSVGAGVLGIVVATSPPAGRGEVPGTPSPATIRSEVRDSGPLGGDASLGSGLGSGLVSGRSGGHPDNRSLAGQRAAR
jgi:anti-sigma factor RsiW